jgi:serine protease
MFRRSKAVLATAALLGAGLSATTAATTAQAAPVAAKSDPIRSYIVQLDAKPTGLLIGRGLRAQSDILATLVGGDVTYVYGTVLKGFALRMPASAAPILRALPGVKSVRKDKVFTADDTQPNPVYGLDRIDQPSLPLDGSYTYPGQAGQGAHVYIIDTGLNADHVEFTGRVGTSRNFVAPLLFGSTDPNDWDDCNGHGTHVASTAAGTTWGVAKKATVHAVRVLDCQGSGSSSSIIAGMNWVAANGQQPAVANMSLGTVTGRATDIENAAKNLVNANVALAVAAGNDSKDACTTSPAAEPTVLTVGATTNTDARASYSNFGTCLDLFAPGSDVVAANYSNNTGSQSLSGTSMASPHVAGGLALVRAANPGRSSTQAQADVVALTAAGKVGNPGTGSVNKILQVPAGGSTPPPPSDAAPVAAFTSSCTALACSFNASGSSDDKGIASYAWTFGDGATGSGVNASRTYAAAGTYSVTLTVTDTVGQTATKTASVTVTAPAGGNAPCTDCTKYTGTLTNGGSVILPNANGFSYGGGTLKGYLRGASGTDFDLALQKYSCFLFCSWSNVASATTNSTDENLSYNGTSGTYRWVVSSYSGAGPFNFWGAPQ